MGGGAWCPLRERERAGEELREKLRGEDQEEGAHSGERRVLGRHRHEAARPPEPSTASWTMENMLYRYCSSSVAYTF